MKNGYWKHKMANESGNCKMEIEKWKCDWKQKGKHLSATIAVSTGDG